VPGAFLLQVLAAAGYALLRVELVAHRCQSVQGHAIYSRGLVAGRLVFCALSPAFEP
jgi:4-hydroxybenzoate polyprenyltransferase